jgi:predicted Ser/Thr protein kinase
MMREAFQKEIKALEFLSKYNLVPKVYGHCVEDMEFDLHYGFIVMERMDGTVKDLLLKRNLNRREQILVEKTIDEPHKVTVHGDLNRRGRIEKCLLLDCAKLHQGTIDHRERDDKKYTRERVK